MEKRLLVGGGLALGCLVILGSCSNDSSEQPATEAMPFSDWSMSCDSGASQQQVGYKHPEQQQGCTKPSVQFPQQGISDFHFDVDCDSRKVNVTRLGGGSGVSSSAGALQTESFPMRADDTFQARMSYPQQVPSDGKGNVSCWVEYVVIFDGRCKCDRRDDGGWKKSVDVTSTMGLQPLGGKPSPSPSPVPSASATPSPSVSASPEPSPSASPEPSPSVSPEPSASPQPGTSPSPGPSASPQPSPRPSVSPRPSPTVVPVVICVIDNNACPWKGDGQMACDPGSQ